MKRKMIIFLCYFMIFSFSCVYAERDMNIGVLYVNNNQIEKNSSVLFENEVILIPLRSALESLGAKVDWIEENNTIKFNYLGESYLCEFHYMDSNDKMITIKNDNVCNGVLGSYIQLNSMSGSGSYEMINDRTYLYQDTGKRLFEALGCNIDIDSENHVVRITNK